MTPMTADEINAFFYKAFPGRDGRTTVEHADGKTARCRIRYDETQLRPGGTLSGPTMMALADMVAYALVFSAIGFSPLSVTTSLSINFLRKPGPADLLAEGRVLKRGKSLLVADVFIRSENEDDPCAHAVVTYSIPPAKVPAHSSSV